VRSKPQHGRSVVSLLAGLFFLSSCSFGTAEVGIPASLPPTTAAGTTSTSTTPVADGSSTTTTEAPEEPVGPVEIQISPADDASTIIQDAPAGSTFVFAPGVHRRFSVRPKDGTSFIGTQGAILSGAVLLSDAVPTEDGWRFDGLEFTGDDHGTCIDGYDGCGLSQDLFIDDVMMWQVTDRDDLVAGTWYWQADSIYVADDPTNRRTEVSVDDFAFVGDNDDVTIRDLVIEKYSTPAQSGAVQSQNPGNGDRGSGWVIEDIEVRGAHGAGIRTGDNTIVRRSYSHHNGQMGISVSGGTDVLLEDNEFAFNNTAGFRWGWEAGGGKFTRTHGLIVRGNYSHDNIGPGLWTDIDAVDTLYELNLVERNTGPGIFHEISYAATIRNNTVIGNGTDSSGWLWGAGIVVAASPEVEVFGNEVRGNANGIAGIQQERGSGDFGPHLLSSLYVHDNIIELGDGGIGIVEDVGDSAVFTDYDNRFNRNIYEGPVGRAYRWDGNQLDRAGWVGAGQDVDGIWR